MKLLAYTRSIVNRAHRARRGQSLVEFALVAPLFFLLVFGITDFGRLFFTQTTLQHALREAGRYAVTGQHLPGTDPDTDDPYTRVKSILKIAQKNAAGLLANPSNIEIKSGGTTGFAGGPGQTVIVSLTTELTLITPLIGRFFPNGVYTFKVSTSFKNEPFDLSEAN